MSNPNSMTVLLVPRGESSEIISVLADYSAVELVDPFVWVDPADIGRTSIPATFVHGGRSHADVLQRILTEQRYQRVRVAVLVPADAPADWRAPRAAEQALEQAVRAAVVGHPDHPAAHPLHPRHPRTPRLRPGRGAQGSGLRGGDQGIQPRRHPVPPQAGGGWRSARRPV
ncbi:hypothetical protein H7H37_00975, partial [Mycolicibacterium insubricum]|nr:hypothetical protein [Mycolicibacterium insubricum]